MADLGAFGTTAGPKARFGPKVLLTYGNGSTTDYATSVLDGGYHRIAIEEVEKIFRPEPVGAAVGRRRFSP